MTDFLLVKGDKITGWGTCKNLTPEKGEKVSFATIFLDGYLLGLISFDHSECYQFPQCAIFLSLVLFMLFLLQIIPFPCPYS